LSKNNELISSTRTNTKVIINMNVAESVLSQEKLKQLNTMLNDLRVIQSVIEKWREKHE
jgi:hypothetical protein